MGDLAGVAFNQSGTNGVGLSSNITDFPTTQLSYELTFSSDQDPTDQIQLGSYAVSGSDNEFLVQAESGAITIILGGAGNVNTGIPSASLFDGNIHTLAVTWDSATGAIDVYVDGISGYSGTYFTGGTLDTGGTFALAQEQDSVGGGFDPNQIFQGTIYGARLYDDVRTPAELSGSTRVPLGDTSDPNLIANWVANPNLSTFTDHTGSHTMTTSGNRSSTWSADDDTLLGGDEPADGHLKGATRTFYFVFRAHGKSGQS